MIRPMNARVAIRLPFLIIQKRNEASKQTAAVQNQESDSARRCGLISRYYPAAPTSFPKSAQPLIALTAIRIAAAAKPAASIQPRVR